MEQIQARPGTRGAAADPVSSPPMEPVPAIELPAARTEDDARLLVVDDDPAARVALRRLLDGYADVTATESGESALALLNAEHFDLVLLDAEMPGMSGLETCHAIKSDPLLADIPVIFVTGHGSQSLETRALELGAADFLTKPVERAQVNARVRAQLRLRGAVAAQQRVMRQLELALSAGRLGAWEWSLAHDRMRWHPTMSAVRHRNATTVQHLDDHFDGLVPREQARVREVFARIRRLGRVESLDYSVEVGEDQRSIHSRMTAMEDEHGRLERVVGIDQDVTDWRRSNTLLLGANRQLEQFVAFASHDLQAPIRQMSAFARLASDRLDEGRTGDAAPLLAQIADASERAQQQVASFLHLARHRLAEPGEWRHDEMRDLVDPVLQELAGEIERSGARIHIAPMGAAYLPVNLVAHIWRNLILNALRHSRGEPRQVWIGERDHGGQTAYYVEDAGLPGQPPATSTLSESALTARNGGLGLQICRQVTRVLGGSMWHEPGEHHGMRMLFTLGDPPADTAGT